MLDLREQFSLLVDYLYELRAKLGFRVTAQRLAILLMALDAPIDSTSCRNRFRELSGVPRQEELRRLRFRHGTYIQLRALAQCDAMSVHKCGTRSVFHLRTPVRQTLEQAIEQIGQRESEFFLDRDAP